MKIRIHYYLICLTLLVSLSSCKKKDYRMNGTYMPYVFENQNYTAPPEGYEPFYINYVGRHGSRFPVSNADITLLRKILNQAQKKGSLSDKGEQLDVRLNRLEQACSGKLGDLSALGEAQMKEIARRMIANYPNIFNEHIYVQTDVAKRCVKSMQSFLSEFHKIVPNEKISIDYLPEKNPMLNFYEVNLAYLEYKNNGIWLDAYKCFADSIYKHANPVKDLFKNKYIDTLQDRNAFMHALYSTYAIIPDTGLDIQLDEYFNGEQLFSLWSVENVRQYLEKGPSPVSEGIATDISFPLLEDFLATSLNAISEGEVSADFRFAHAETIIPFAALLGIPEASARVSDLNVVSLKWLDFQVAPMAANIQWIFYSNDAGHFLVKMLLNEKEVQFPFESQSAPYYDWDEVRTYYQRKLEELPVIPSFSTERQVKYFKHKSK